MCSRCQATLAVKHILTKFTHLAPVSYKYNKENNIKNLFGNIEIHKLIYLKTVNIFLKG